jgi:hypothetical protein
MDVTICQLVGTYLSDTWSPGKLFLTGLDIAVRLRTPLTYPCRLFLNSNDLTYARLKESTSYFGFNPRRCFQTGSSARRLIQLQQSLEEEARSTSPKVKISTIFAETYSSSGLSHSIFELSPEDDIRLLGSARVGAVSMWALDLLLKKYEPTGCSAQFLSFHHGHAVCGNPP